MLPWPCPQAACSGSLRLRFKVIGAEQGARAITVGVSGEACQLIFRLHSCKPGIFVDSRSETKPSRKHVPTSDLEDRKAASEIGQSIQRGSSAEKLHSLEVVSGMGICLPPFLSYNTRGDTLQYSLSRTPPIESQTLAVSDSPCS